MSAHDGDKGVGTDLAKQAAGKAHDIAGWLDEREPGRLVSEVRSFARERPGAFLAIALGAGLVTARLGRGVAEASSDDESSSPSTTQSLDAPVPTGYGYGDVETSVPPVTGYAGAAPGTEGLADLGLDAPQEGATGGVG